MQELIGGSMTGLQEAFYIMSIVYMSIMLILVIALVVSVLVIRKKVNRIHDNIESKINSVTSIAEKGGALAAVVTAKAAKKAKKALSKK
jgi:Na+-transporting methylmalonyl-CoA/oxaloacetate decarboxylase gamma subunit